MALESMMLYSCAVCGNAMAGLEWEEHTGRLKDYKCPSCNHMLNEDELYPEEQPDKDNLADKPELSKNRGEQNNG